MMQPNPKFRPATAVQPQFRRQGLGTRLLALADETAEVSGKRGTSVIVSDGNTGARRLLRALRLQEECHEVNGQRELEERGAALGSADEGPLSDVRVWRQADLFIVEPVCLLSSA